MCMIKLHVEEAPSVRLRMAAMWRLGIRQTYVRSLTSKICAQGVHGGRHDPAYGFKEVVTALVEFCNLFILEGAFRKPDTMQKG